MECVYKVSVGLHNKLVLAKGTCVVVVAKA